MAGEDPVESSSYALIRFLFEKVSGAIQAVVRRYWPVILVRVRVEDNREFDELLQRAYECWLNHATIAKSDLDDREEISRIFSDCKVLEEKPEWRWVEYMLLAQHRDDQRHYCASLWGHYRRGSTLLFVSYLGVNKALMKDENYSRRQLVKRRLMKGLFEDLRGGELEKIEGLVFEMTPPTTAGPEFSRAATFFQEEANAQKWSVGRLDLKYLQPRLEMSGHGKEKEKYLCVALRRMANRRTVPKEHANAIIRFVYDELYPSAYPVHETHPDSQVQMIDSYQKYLGGLRDRVMVQRDVQLLPLRP